MNYRDGRRSRDDVRGYPQDAAQHNENRNERWGYRDPASYQSSGQAESDRGTYERDRGYNAQYYGPSRRPQNDAPARRETRPLFGPNYGDNPDQDIAGSSLEVDDYAFFNAGNYGRHYGSGYGTAQPARSQADQNLKNDWYAAPTHNTQSERVLSNRFTEDPGHRGRGPRGYMRSDERILEEVHERLTDDRHLDASNITVIVKDREVTLNGTVENRQAKRHAEDIVERISGVLHTQNNLRVNETKTVWEKESEGVAQATAQIKTS